MDPLNSYLVNISEYYENENIVPQTRENSEPNVEQKWFGVALVIIGITGAGLTALTIKKIPLAASITLGIVSILFILGGAFMVVQKVENGEIQWGRLNTNALFIP